MTGARLWLCAACLAANLLAVHPAAAESPPNPSPTIAATGFVTLQQLRAQYADPAARYMTIQGVDIRYKDEGSGPVILMVHGSSSSLDNFDVIVARLKSRYRIVRYDIPSEGLSGPVSDAVAASGLRPEDVAEALLANLGVKSATVVGVSSGGTLGYFLAAKRPDLVERLILASTPSAPVGPSAARLKLSRHWAEEQAIGGPQLGDGFKRRSYWDAFFEFFAGEPERISPAIRQQYYDFNRRLPDAHHFALMAFTTDNAATRLAASKVDCPVLLVWGGRDPLLPPQAMDMLAGYLNNAEVSTLMLPDVGHYPPLEAPARFAQIVSAYIEAVTPVKPIAKPPADR